MNINFNGVYYEPSVLEYPLGQYLKEKFATLNWVEIQSHNHIPQFREAENSAFPKLKRNLILGIRKTHKYVENHKVSDFLVPFTSSGCSAMCLYCYLVCNYNKCAYLRLFVNREQMMDKLVDTANTAPYTHTFEIGSNSDLILENSITHNLSWTIEQFASRAKGKLTFPTKFDMVEPLLHLNHQRKTIFRMSVNPQELIRKVELGTSSLDDRIMALNKMCKAGYPVGILLAPIILVPQWQTLYAQFISHLADTLSEKVKQTAFVEVIFMTYSFVHHAINTEAFPNALQLYQKDLMVGRGRGKYCYKDSLRAQGEQFLREQLHEKLGQMPILYMV